MTARNVTLSQAFQIGLREEMERDETIIVLGTDLFDRGGHWGQISGLGQLFGPDRIRDTPISEAAMLAAGLGAAVNGLRPIVDLNFIDFILGGMDEVVNQAAKARYMWGVDVPLVIRGTSGVAFGGPQHNNSLEAWFAHTPGLVVAYPSTPADTYGMIKASLRGQDPVIFLMHKMLTGERGELPETTETVPLGTACVVRSGRHVTVVVYGVTVGKALKAAERLAEDGIEAEVIDLRTLTPLDFRTIAQSVSKTAHAVVAGEAPVFASVVSEVAATIQEELFYDLDGPVLRVASAGAPIPHSPPLFQSMIPNEDQIRRACRRLVQG